MDHAQGRAFHHHLARAIMHMNHLASLLPFFEPSIAWDDPMLDTQFRLGRPTHTSRSLHTFVPLPSASNPPTMVSHGGIPSHMIVNPEPNLRPLTRTRYPREEKDYIYDYIPGSDTATRNPVPNEGHPTTLPPGTTTGPDHPRTTTRITMPVPVRSKQRTTSTEDPQPKKKQKSASGPESTARLCLFPSSQKRASTRTTRMMMQHPKPHPHMITQLSTSVEMPQYHPPPPLPHHQALPRHWFSHQIPPFESSNLQKLLDLQVTQHSGPGLTLMIKSGSISRMTPNPVLRGRRLELDFVVILRCASWDGESWIKRTNMVTFTRLTNQRLRTKRQGHPQKGKECACLSSCRHAAASLLPSCLPFLFLSLLFFSFPFFSFLHASSCDFPSVHMAHAYSSDYVRIAPDRSRSRDEPMWQNRNHHRRRQHRDTWHDVPPVRQPRRVLIIVNLEAVRPLMTAVYDDAMDSTTCQSLPSLGRMEELDLFTYHVLIHPYHVETLTVNILLYYISQHIMYTWDRLLEPTSMDLRWQDNTKNTFVLRNEYRLIDLLREFRPHWTEGQEIGILFPNNVRPFTSQNQPYIMRLSCHEALPNRNMLP